MAGRLSIPPRTKQGLLLAAIEDQRVMTKVPFNSPPREAGIATLAVVVRVCWHSTFNSTPREAGIATTQPSLSCHTAFRLSIPPRAKRGLLLINSLNSTIQDLTFNLTPRQAGL